MGKYDPLGRHLQSINATHVPMAFKEVAQIIGLPLPTSAYRYPAWWENEHKAGSHVQSKAWLKAGYETSNVNFGAETLCFIRQK